MAALVLATRPYTASKVWVTVLRDSCDIRLSSLRSSTSMPFFPNSLLTNFSAARLDMVDCQSNRLTKTSLVNLLGRLSKDGQYLSRYCDDHVGHCRSGRDLGINPELCDEAFNTFEELHNVVIVFYR